MDHNDITRRRALTIFGLSAGALAFSGTVLPALAYATTDTDQQEEGPFYVDEGLFRSDIRGGESGVPLTLTMTVLDDTAGAPLVGAAVDIWHANAGGAYSDESSESTVGQTWLRGIQLTDGNGQVTFTTVMPGWYAGRTNHIHAKVRQGGAQSGTSYSGGTTIWTGQVFMPESVNTAVAAVAPYTANSTARTVNRSDRVYTQQHGDENLLAMTGSVSSGYTGKGSLTVNGDGSSASGTSSTSPAIAGAAYRTTKYGSTVTLSGTAPAGSSVELYSRALGASSYGLARTLTASSSGTWSTAYKAGNSYSLYVEVDGDVSDVVTIKIAPTVDGAASRTVKKGSRITLTGTSQAGTNVKVSMLASGSSRYVSSTVKAGSNGVWSKTFTCATNYHVYVVAQDGVASKTYLIYAK